MAVARLSPYEEQPVKASEPEREPLVGCVTGAAQDVIRNIRRAAVSAQLMRFLLLAYDRSFSTAGYQRRAGRKAPGGSCAFENSAWAQEMGIERQNLWRLRRQAEALGLMFYEQDETDPSRGRARAGRHQHPVSQPVVPLAAGQLRYVSPE